MLAALAPRGGVEEVRVTEEEEYFPPPRALRNLLTAIDVVGALGLGGDPTGPHRSTTATAPPSTVLAALG